MQIQLNQNDIETAVRNYVSAMGISRPVDEIQFSVSRKGGQSIEAEIDLADCTGGARPDRQVADQTGGPVKAEPKTQTTKAEQKEDPAPAKTEEVSEEKDDTPFTPDQKADASNDTDTSAEEAEEPVKGKSLFG